MTTDYSEFIGFPKITRYSNVKFYLTEKIDGTNACVAFDTEGNITVQSRKRIITPESDNFGFATWATAHADELFTFMGPGRHYGEWWGLGIQRGYDQTRRWFTPFNTHQFNAERDDWPDDMKPLPVLAITNMGGLNYTVRLAEQEMDEWGSYIAPGFMRPEGIMLWSRETGYLKHPFDGGAHKWQQEQEAA